MFVTLSIDEEVDQEQNQSTTTTDDCVLVNKKKTKRKTKKPRIVFNVASILQSYDIDNCSDDNDDSDEVDEYYKMKLSINNNECILKWWKERSVIFPK